MECILVNGESRRNQTIAKSLVRPFWTPCQANSYTLLRIA
jgi:hypothetical protein